MTKGNAQPLGNFNRPFSAVVNTNQNPIYESVAALPEQFTAVLSINDLPSIGKGTKREYMQQLIIVADLSQHGSTQWADPTNTDTIMQSLTGLPLLLEQLQPLLQET